MFSKPTPVTCSRSAAVIYLRSESVSGRVLFWITYLCPDTVYMTYVSVPQHSIYTTMCIFLSIHTICQFVNESASACGAVNCASVSLQRPSICLHELIKEVLALQRTGTTARITLSWSCNTFINYRNSPPHEPILPYQSHIPTFILILFCFPHFSLCCNLFLTYNDLWRNTQWFIMCCVSLLLSVQSSQTWGPVGALLLFISL